MKKKLFLFFILILVIVSTGCSVKKIEKVENSESIKFKEEYESLNGKELGITIPENNQIKYASFDEVMDVLETGTGVIYFGSPDCSWCRSAVPILLNSALDNNLDKILYFNASDIRDEKHLDEAGNVIVDQEGTEQYYQLIEKLSEVLSPYEKLQDSSIKRLYFPTVIFVKNGKIVASHEGTVSEQEDSSVRLTKRQADELYQIYTNGIQKVLGIYCDEDSVC